MKVALTGASGYFAKYVRHELMHHGYDIIAIDKRPLPDHDDRFPFVYADLTRLDEAKRALDGADAVIHLAGIPHPLSDPADAVYAANALGAFSTAWAAGEIGATKFIYASSESVLGTAFHPELFKPRSFPIDESHPTVPLDPYGISKVAAEKAVESCGARFGFAAVALRMPWIWGMDDSDRRSFYTQLITEYPNWQKNLWAYVDARDAARAFTQTLKAKLAPKSFEAYYVVADQTWVASIRKSKDLIKDFFPGVRAKKNDDAYFSLIANAKAKQELGWSPAFSVDALLR